MTQACKYLVRGVWKKIFHVPRRVVRLIVMSHDSERARTSLYSSHSTRPQLGPGGNLDTGPSVVASMGHPAAAHYHRAPQAWEGQGMCAHAHPTRMGNGNAGAYGPGDAYGGQVDCSLPRGMGHQMVGACAPASGGTNVQHQFVIRDNGIGAAGAYGPGVHEHGGAMYFSPPRGARQQTAGVCAPSSVCSQLQSGQWQGGHGLQRCAYAYTPAGTAAGVYESPQATCFRQQPGFREHMQSVAPPPFVCSTPIHQTSHVASHPILGDVYGSPQAHAQAAGPRSNVQPPAFSYPPMQAAAPTVLASGGGRRPMQPAPVRAPSFDMPRMPGDAQNGVATGAVHVDPEGAQSEYDAMREYASRLEQELAAVRRVTASEERQRAMGEQPPSANAIVRPQAATEQTCGAQLLTPPTHELLSAPPSWLSEDGQRRLERGSPAGIPSGARPRLSTTAHVPTHGACAPQLGPGGNLDTGPSGSPTSRILWSYGEIRQAGSAEGGRWVLSQAMLS